MSRRILVPILGQAYEVLLASGSEDSPILVGNQRPLARMHTKCFKLHKSIFRREWGRMSCDPQECHWSGCTLRMSSCYVEVAASEPLHSEHSET